jgi:hypothetical protein
VIDSGHVGLEVLLAPAATVAPGDDDHLVFTIVLWRAVDETAAGAWLRIFVQAHGALGVARAVNLVAEFQVSHADETVAIDMPPAGPTVADPRHAYRRPAHAV